MVTQVIVLAILILVNAFFAATEIAFISINDAKIEKQAKEGNKKAMTRSFKSSLLKLAAVFAVGTMLLSGCSLVKTFSLFDPESNKKIKENDVKMEKMFEAPKSGEKIAVMHTTMGDIKIKFFPDEAPKAVENFLTHAENGYYDGIIFHRVIDGFMVQGGDPMGTGIGGESAWGGQFDGGTDPHLVHVSGALAYANSGSTATDGSQFYVVTGTKYTDEQLKELEEKGVVTVVRTVETQPEESMQMSFGAAASNEITEKLKALDVNTLTPIEALQKLYELKLEAEKI